YKATLKALAETDLPIPASCDAEAEKSVRVYEIGRKAYHKLSDPGTAGPENSTNEPRGNFSHAMAWVLLGIVALISLLLLQFQVSGTPMTGLGWIVAGTAAFGGLAYWVAKDTETAAWLDGVSIWPSEICRLAAGAAAGAFFFRARRLLSENGTDVLMSYKDA